MELSVLCNPEVAEPVEKNCHFLFHIIKGETVFLQFPHANLQICSNFF